MFLFYILVICPVVITKQQTETIPLIINRASEILKIVEYWKSLKTFWSAVKIFRAQIWVNLTMKGINWNEKIEILCPLLLGCSNVSMETCNLCYVFHSWRYFLWRCSQNTTLRLIVVNPIHIHDGIALNQLLNGMASIFFIVIADHQQKNNIFVKYVSNTPPHIRKCFPLSLSWWVEGIVVLPEINHYVSAIPSQIIKCYHLGLFNRIA